MGKGEVASSTLKNAFPFKSKAQVPRTGKGTVRFSRIAKNGNLRGVFILNYQAAGYKSVRNRISH